MICEYLRMCTFIENGALAAPFTTNMTKIKYCERSKRGCARYNAYKVLDADLVPDDLWPNEEIKVLEGMEKMIKETHVLLRNSAGIK